MSCTLAQEQELINLFSTLHYHKIINLATRITQQSSSLLDNIYTTLPYHNSSKGVLISDHSDHYIVFTIQHGTTSTKTPILRKIRNFSEQNISKFKKKIQHGTNFMLYLLLKMHTEYLQTILIIISKSVSHIKSSKLITRINLDWGGA